MDEPNLRELETTAAAYEERLVPAIMAEWVPRLLDAAAVGPGDRVLDVACGTGVVARTAAASVGPGGRVTGLDVNPGMLAVARRLAPAIECREGEAEKLPFADGSFDAALCQFGLMFFADRAAALREMMRVLAPGGRLAVSVFDSLESNAAYGIMVDVLGRQIDEHAAGALRLPFALGDTAELGALFEAAGIPAPAIVRREGRERFASVRDMVLADVRGWFPFAGIRPDGAAVEAVVAEAEVALAGLRTRDGAVEFPNFVYIVAAGKR
jgi:SAM-dependent methyltransferase